MELLSPIDDITETWSVGGEASILLVGPNSYVVESIAVAIARISYYNVSTARSVEMALQIINARGRFNVVLYEYGPGSATGLESLLKLIKGNGGGVAFFSRPLPKPFLDRAVAIGAAGYLPTTMALQSFLNAVCFIAMGEKYLPPKYTIRRETFSTKDRFDELDYMILSCLCEGLDNTRVCAIVGQDMLKVKRRVSLLLKKFGVKSRTQLMLIARSEDLLSEIPLVC
jgi:two-component system, NarL family, nitrate/nitrite response regulator NarL